MDGEEDSQDLGERDESRIEGDLHDFRVSRRVRAHHLVGRIAHVAARIADLDLLHAAKLLEHRLQTPEAAATQCDYLLARLHRVAFGFSARSRAD